MRQFAKISQIDPSNEQSWREKLFLTFDIDWAHDEVLSDTIDLVEAAGVCATWFVTHDTPLLERLRKNTKFEIGVHPNFNFLLQGDERNGCDAGEVLERLIALVPEAKSVRSHSMAQSSGLLECFNKSGLTHDVNHFVPYRADITLKPWVLWNLLCRVPYCWEDDVHMLYEDKGLSEKSPHDVAIDTNNGVKVFDFHPIHVFLNTEKMCRYENTRPWHRDPNELIKHRWEGWGSRNRLQELLELEKKPCG